MQIPDSIPEAGNLLRSALPQQMLDLKLKLGNGALATLGPILKGLRLLESLCRNADCDHLRTKYARSRCQNFCRELRLNGDPDQCHCASLSSEVYGGEEA